jgi:hypothetical protein
MKRLWALRSVVGLLLVFGSAVALFAWASWQYPVYVGVGIVLLITLMAAKQPGIRRERERTRKLVDAAFRDAYAELSPPPSILTSSQYGYPAFEVKFCSKLEMNAASIRNEAFKSEINTIFKGYGSRRRPFSAEKAIFFTYKTVSGVPTTRRPDNIV